MSRVLSRPREESAGVYDVEAVRRDFPILSRRVHDRPLVYLDNAATTQKPRMVLDAMTRAYEHSYANVHRGVHLLSVEATDAYEHAREAARRFLNARDSKEIIFVRGATEGINLVAQSFGGRFVRAGDEVVITALEHHSNIVPWQILCEEKGARLRVVPIDRTGAVIVEDFERILGPNTRIAAISHVSNALGTVTPVRRLIELAHAKGIPVLVDGAQAAPRLPVDVQDLDADFYVFSGHKLYGPTGIGVLYGKSSLLERMPPYQAGGDMIRSVTFEKTSYNVLPYKFEAGTPNIVGAIGLAAAIEYLERLGMENLARHEDDLLAHATAALTSIPGVRIIGTAPKKASVLSFTIDGVHPHDIGTVLDREGIAVRTGHHCAQPVMEFFEIPATARASFGAYNTRAEIAALAAGIQKVLEMFR